MKPDWNAAPEWANYVAMDADGEWYWYASKPVMADQVWTSTGGQTGLAANAETDWKDTLEGRP